MFNKLYYVECTEQHYMPCEQHEFMSFCVRYGISKWSQIKLEGYKELFIVFGALPPASTSINFGITIVTWSGISTKIST